MEKNYTNQRSIKKKIGLFLLSILIAAYIYAQSGQEVSNKRVLSVRLRDIVEFL